MRRTDDSKWYFHPLWAWMSTWAQYVTVFLLGLAAGVVLFVHYGVCP